MADINPLEYKQAIGGAIVGVVLAILGISGPLNPVTVRPDPFTGSDGRLLEEKMKQYVDHRFEIHSLRIPPQQTRRRIMELEEWAEKQPGNYRRPTQEW